MGRFDARSIRLSVAAQGRWTLLAVENQGAGIPEKDLPFIFERFYTADRSRARGRSGSGLGLAIVREIVQAHHGRIEAASLPGFGARFTIRLPRAIATGLHTTMCWLRRSAGRYSVVTAVAVGLLTALATYAGGPLAAALVGVLGSAFNLLSLAQAVETGAEALGALGRH